jgi:thioredoxin
MDDVSRSKLPKSFDDLIRSSDKPVLVDFWAEWCGPCKMVAPVIKQIASEYSGKLITIKINIDKKPDIAARYQIQSIPTIMMFWKGTPIMRAMGAQPYSKLKSQIESNWPR